MGGGGGSNQVQKSEVTQSSLPEYARPYFEGLMQRANTNLTTPYIPYGYTQDKTTGKVVQAVDAQGKPINPQRIADFTSDQITNQQNVMNLRTPGQFNTASTLATAAGLGSLQAGQYNTGQFNAQQIGMPNLQTYSMRGPADVQAQQYGTPQMQASQTDYNPNLNYFQQQGPQQFGSTQASQYMSPYTQNVIDVQKNEAIRDAQKGQLAQNLGAARQGTYGGARQLLASTERERNLGSQLGQIQAQGQQAAYQNAQEQFERDRAAGMTTSAQNQQAALQTQQLGTETGLRTALANLDANSQASVQNLAAQLQTQGLNADQALRAALANQQSGLQVGQQNLEAALQTQQLGTQSGLAALQSNQQADLERQRMGEQSRQFGSSQGLAGLAQAGQMGQTLANIGSAQSQADQARLGMQQSTAAQSQALNQQYLDQAYQNFLRERDYPMEQMQQYSSLLRGVPVTPNTTSTTYAPTASLGSQLVSGGLGAAALYNTANRAGVI
jgi:hypothetical protein